MHREIIRRYKTLCAQQEFRTSAILSIVLFLFSIFVVQPFAVQYATQRASNAVDDIVLSNIPVFNVDEFFVYGMFLFVVVVAVLLMTHPKRIPFVLYALTLFVLIRAAFVSLTHIGPYPTQTSIDFGAAITKIFFGADLFFSGHTGAPFLLALIFWQEPRLRYLFLAWSVFFAAIVLLGHVHYTIDVLSAFFITYGIYHLALWLFPKDYALFRSKN